MPDEAYLAAWRALREHDHKYAYYKLTIVGAAIALAINQTNDAALSWRQVPLALAVLMWGLSMWFGFSHLKSVRNVLIQDAYRSGDFEASVLKAIQSGNVQEVFLLLGAVFYLAWHIIEMYLRR